MGKTYRSRTSIKYMMRNICILLNIGKIVSPFVSLCTAPFHFHLSTHGCFAVSFHYRWWSSVKENLDFSQIFVVKHAFIDSLMTFPWLGCLLDFPGEIEDQLQDTKVLVFFVEHKIIPRIVHSTAYRSFPKNIANDCISWLQAVLKWNPSNEIHLTKSPGVPQCILASGNSAGSLFCEIDILGLAFTTGSIYW